jgi:chromosome segregation ATPase
MSASTEALALVALVANGPKYRERLQELIATTEKADAAVANLKVAEKASAEKLEAAEALLGSLQAQIDEVQSHNATARAKIEADAADLTRRETELEAAKVAHAGEVKNSLQIFEAREAELTQRQAALDVDFHRRLEDLRGVENKLRDHHVGLRAIIDETRRGMEAVAA